MITFILVIIGALNWGLIWIFDFNLVGYIFGDSSITARIIYTLVWISAIVELISHTKSCKMCK